MLASNPASSVNHNSIDSGISSRFGQPMKRSRAVRDLFAWLYGTKVHLRIRWFLRYG
jgi:hypothetical protein